MRNAPTVVFPVRRCAFYAGLLYSLAAFSLLVLLLWWWPWLVAVVQAPARMVLVAGCLGALLWLVWVVFAWRSWLHAPVGRLQWDALGLPVADPDVDPSAGPVRPGVWLWYREGSADGAPLQRVERALALQNRMLLRVRSTDGAHCWLWVQRCSNPALWNDLRRALVHAQT